MPDYSKFDKDQLVKIIIRQDKDLKTKKLGLVWDSEREPEQIVLDCENNLPILKRLKSKEVRTNDCEDNILIEGDNYHALTVLNYTHKEKVDVIYIDPPYNTGNKSWKYNNNYVEKDDGYRHSKWLNMMQKRLNIAKKLLKKDGCLICAIDENEHATLGLLLKKIFKSYKIDCITIVHNPRGIQGKDFSYCHEYAFFVYPEKAKSSYIGTMLREEEDWEYSNLRNWGGESERHYGKSLFYPIHTKNGEVVDVGEMPSDEFHPKEPYTEKEGVITFWPIDGNGVERKWRYASDSIDSIRHLLKVNEVSDTLQLQLLKDDDRYKTVWAEKKYDANSYGTQLVKEIVGVSFPFPKSLYNVEECLLAVAKNKKNAMILDFFAGSGTTGHAVLKINKEDGGNRKFILCTNNEGDICKDVTYPRIHNVIKGYKYKGKDKTMLLEKRLTFSKLHKSIKPKKDEAKKEFEERKKDVLDKNIIKIWQEIDKVITENIDNYDDIEKVFENNTIKIIGVKDIVDKKSGIGGNLQYFQTALIKKSKNRDQVKIDLTQKCTEMLCVKDNIFNLETEEQDFKIYSSNKKNVYLCVYYNIIDESFDDFLEEIKKLRGRKHVYMFSIDNKLDKSPFVGIPNLKLEPVPQIILGVYKELVKMNIPVKANVIFTDFVKAKAKIFDDKDKDGGARILRIVLEKLIQKLSQDNGINILNAQGKEMKLTVLNDMLKRDNVITQTQWEENKTFMTIGNDAAHGNYEEYDLRQVKRFYKHIQLLINSNNI